MDSSMPADATATAIAAANAAVAAAEASAAEGDANASLAYTLSNQILQDGQFEAIIPLDTLVAKAIAKGLQAYAQVNANEALAMQKCQLAMSAANRHAKSLFQQYGEQFESILGGKGND